MDSGDGVARAEGEHVADHIGSIALHAMKEGADLPAKERRFLADALRAVAKRFEQIADKIDIDEPREMTSISPDAPGAAP